jgi:hypothetical protein
MGRVWRCLKPLAPQLLTNALMVAVLAGWPQARPGRHRGGGMVVGVDVWTAHRPVPLGGPLRVGQAVGRQPGELDAQLLRGGWAAAEEHVQPLVAEHLDELLGVISDDRYQLQPTG